MEMAVFNNIMQWLASAYRTNLEKETIMLYYMKFKDVSDDRFKKACNSIIDSSKFFPSIAEIKEVLNTIPSNAMQLERKKYCISDWDNPVELPSHEEIERELAKVLAERKAKNEYNKSW